MKETMKKFEFSKIIVVIVSAMTLAVMAFTCYMVYDTKNLEPLSTLTALVFGAFATCTGFYYSKSALENRIKLRKKYGSEIFNDAKGEDTDDA
jgi:hypothetical protein